MATTLLYLVLLVNAAASLVNPWVGVVNAYFLAILAPQYIWWWVFMDLRSYYWAIVPTLAGFAIGVLRGKIGFSALKTRINACVGILWFSTVLSYYFGSYVDVVNPYRFYNPEFMFSTFQKTLLTYFVAVILISDIKKLKIGTLVILVSTIYMTYWANAQYFLYHKYGRVHGPTNLYGQGIYSDENNFAVLFVIGFPFIYYLGQYLGKLSMKVIAAAVVLFSWHAVFLTASRGALLGIAAVLLVFFLRLEKRTWGLVVICGFVAAFVWQAGDVMKSRSATITSYQQEDSASERLEAWSAAIGMMVSHPVTGVGFASFGQAFPDFSDKVPRIAHNTFFQIGGEWGIVAGITYLVLIFSTLNRLRKNGNRLRLRSGSTDADDKVYYYINESCLLGLTGFFVCSLFLSLQAYEVFYHLLILSNAILLSSNTLFGDSTAGARNAGDMRLPVRTGKRV